jgi:hypothetical protein
MEGDVELALGAYEVPYLGCRQRLGIMAEWHALRHRLGADPRAKVGQGLRQRAGSLVACEGRARHGAQ